MQVVYYNEEMPYKFASSLFLAGPSLRSGQEGDSWRETALQILRDKGYKGVIFVPENRDGRLDENHDYDDTVSWEQHHLDIADQILFWVPRSEELIGLTTNIEFGNYIESGRVVLGWPEEAIKMKYFEYCANQNKIPIHHTLTETIETALENIGEGSERSLGERYIPLFLWKTDTFQRWYKSLLKSGNRLENAETLLTIRPNNEVAIWIVRPNIYIASEDRYKSVEVVIGRSDISSVCMWKRVNEDVEVVLVKEARSSCSNGIGFIYELPSGHSPDETKTPEETAIQEVREEVGLHIDEKRLKYISKRQLAGTMLSHKSHLFAYELNDEELEWLKSQKGISKGVKKEGERTFIEVCKLSEIIEKELVDWVNIGQILQVMQ